MAPVASQSGSALDRAVALVDALVAELAAAVGEGSHASVPAITQVPDPTATAPLPTTTEADPTPKLPSESKTAKKVASKKGADNVAASQSANASADDDLFSKALIKVGRVASVEPHPVADKLWLLKVDVGEPEKRQVCAGLRHYVPAEALSGALVCCVCNLKPAKLAGTLSEAMILAAESEIEGGKLSVQTLAPPAGASPGDQVFVKGGQPSTSYTKQLSSKVWALVGPLLQVQGGNAIYAGAELVTSAGVITVPHTPDGAAIK
eukprot:jgi/Chlat1/689/Chrsp104S01167